ncbi:MAG TPA: hypothetical protein VIG74_05025 [Alphaproteobacteria bacterium]|jgi:hypothetical protein
MTRPPRRKPVLLLTIVLLLAAWLWVPSHLVKRSVMNELKSLGFSISSVGKVRKEKGFIVFSDIGLDGNKFSTIENLMAKGGLTGLQSLAADNLVLTAEMPTWTALTVTGWSWPPALRMPKAPLLDLKNGQVDLLTPEGAVRLTAKAQALLQPDGSEKIKAIVTGEQNQLTVDTRWDIHIRRPGQGWTAAAEINEGRFNLKSLTASRISGWLNVESAAASPLPLLSGQLSAGQLRFGEQTTFTNLTLTIDNGKDGSQHIILQAGITPYEGMILTADISGLPGVPAIDTTIETKSLPDLLTFITTLQKDMNGANGSDGILTSLLLTPGNLARVEKEVKRAARYDSLELSISGNLYDLIGKIVAVTNKDGSVQRHIISLDPG